MKKELRKKLLLAKQTIARLDEKQLKRIQGQGTILFFCDPATEGGCPTDVCTTTGGCCVPWTDGCTTPYATCAPCIP